MADEKKRAAVTSGLQGTELDGSRISTPGCYLHVTSGLLIRLDAEDLADDGFRSSLRDAGRVAMLSTNPNAPLDQLREIAARQHYRTNF